MTASFFASATTIYMHPEFSTKHSKPGAKKTDTDKTYTQFPPFMTQQEEDRLSNQPTSGKTGYRNAIIYRIVHEK